MATCTGRTMRGAAPRGPRRDGAGSIGFFGPPEPAPDGVLEAEVGYGLVGPAAGASTEALTALLVETDRAGSGCARASSRNKASIRVLAMRVHRAARQQRGRPPGHGPAAAVRMRPVGAARAGRHRPRRHPGPRRRERVAVHRGRCWRASGNRHPGRVRDRSAAAVDRGGLRARQVARHRDRLQRGSSGTSPGTGRAWAPHRARAGVSVCELLRAAVPAPSPRSSASTGIGLEPEFRERYGIPEGSRRGPVAELFDRPCAQAARPARAACAAGVLGRRRGGGRGRLVITWSSTTALLEISAPG